MTLEDIKTKEKKRNQAIKENPMIEKSWSDLFHEMFVMKMKYPKVAEDTSEADDVSLSVNEIKYLPEPENLNSDNWNIVLNYYQKLKKEIDKRYNYN